MILLYFDWIFTDSGFLGFGIWVGIRVGHGEGFIGHGIGIVESIGDGRTEDETRGGEDGREERKNEGVPPHVCGDAVAGGGSSSLSFVYME